MSHQLTSEMPAERIQVDADTVIVLRQRSIDVMAETNTMPHCDWVGTIVRSGKQRGSHYGECREESLDRAKHALAGDPLPL